MKRKTLLSVVLTVVMCFLQINTVYALQSTHNNELVSSITSIEYFNDGSYIVTEIIQSTSNYAKGAATTTTGTKTKTYYSSSNVALCALKITASFSHNGSTVSCVGTSHTEYSYDNSWSVQNVTTSHGNSSSTKAYGKASGYFVKKILGITMNTISTSVTVYCDKDGNLS